MKKKPEMSEGTPRITVGSNHFLPGNPWLKLKGYRTSQHWTSPRFTLFFSKRNSGWSNINTPYTTHILYSQQPTLLCHLGSANTFSPPCLLKYHTQHHHHSLQLLVPDAYLSRASSLIPINRFTLWLSANCFLSSCRQVCKDVGREAQRLMVSKNHLSLRCQT